jgi:hypothetical protein
LDRSSHHVGYFYPRFLIPGPVDSAVNYREIYGAPLDYNTYDYDPAHAHWAGIATAEDTNDDMPVITPRMAPILIASAMLHRDNLSICHDSGDFPDMVGPFMANAGWRAAYLDCVDRLALRLRKTFEFSPNCTGEEMVPSPRLNV